MAKHLIIRSSQHRSVEYGMLFDFTEAIQKITGGDFEIIEANTYPDYIMRRAGHSMRCSFLRQWLPKSNVSFEADVLWVALMAPNDFNLDLYAGWQNRCKFKILYLIDTFPHQYGIIRKITAKYHFDLLITSFSHATKDLERITNQPWHFVPQGISLKRFYPRGSMSDRPPIFSVSYGRKDRPVHNAIRKWTSEKRLWYDYTTSASYGLSVSPDEHYDCYANHLGNAFLNLSWSVEATNPNRAMHLSPITCRWFEGAASANVMVGQKPKDPNFSQFFDPDAVVELGDISGEELERLMDKLHHDYAFYREKAFDMLKRRSAQWSWDARVCSILDKVDTKK